MEDPMRLQTLAQSPTIRDSLGRFDGSIEYRYQIERKVKYSEPMRQKEEDVRHILREEKGDDPDARVCVDDLLRCEIYVMKCLYIRPFLQDSL